MTAQTRIIVGGLLAAVVTLGAVLGVVLATDDGNGDRDSRPHAMDTDDGFMGMMGAMAGMDSDAMLDHMRDVLGEDGYQRMLAHFQEHRDGGPMTGDPEVDDMMHRMMDGMMQHMPADSGNIFPPGNDQHHETPGPAMTP
jgi:hypothetical protein